MGKVPGQALRGGRSGRVVRGRGTSARRGEPGDSMLIEWPDRYAPRRAGVHVHNELEMPVPPEAVWAWLIRAELWPTWYSNSRKVEVEGGPDLSLGSSFRWTTFGIRLRSRVKEFVPCGRLAWSADAAGVHAIHVWLIERRPTGCFVVTEESQNGGLARLSNLLRPGNISRHHQDWLEGLLRKAKGGPPPAIGDHTPTGRRAIEPSPQPARPSRE